MATIADIETRVSGYTGRDDLASRIATAVQDAIVQIQRKGNHYFMEEVAERSLVVNRQDYAVPSDFKDAGDFYLLEANGEVNLPPLEQISFEEGQENFGMLRQGDPEKYSLYRGALWVWPPKPQDAAKKLRLGYYKFLPTISGGSSNELTTQWPDLVTTWATAWFYAQLPNAEKQSEFWFKLAAPTYEELVRFSNAKKLKNKVVLRPRTSPRMRDIRTSRVFGGREGWGW